MKLLEWALDTQNKTQTTIGSDNFLPFRIYTIHYSILHTILILLLWESCMKEIKLAKIIN